MRIKSTVILLAMLLLCIIDTNGQSMDLGIEGTTWIDHDDDGVRSVGDTPLPKVKVDLFDEQGEMIQFTLSDDNGNYSFTNLPTGVYYIKFEKKQGLKMALKDAGDDNIDSDIASNGISSFFLLDSITSIVKLDAGFRSSIFIQTKAFIKICEGELVDINPTILGSNGDLSFHWSHDESTNSSTSFIADSNLLIKLTVTDHWNSPVVKNISIIMTNGVSSKKCEDVDIFNFSEVPIDLFVSESNPGPVSKIDIDETFIGGGRNISIELLEGENISSINSSNAGVFINNCSGCRTSTTLTYFSPTNEYIDISSYNYFELTEMIIDQGNVEVTISITDDLTTSSLSDKIESEGPSTDILPVFFFKNFDKYDQIDFSKLRTISLNFTSINESIDILMSSILSCNDERCNTTLIASQDICLSESVSLIPESTCTDGLIFLWDELGFGKEKTVSPVDTTTYTLTVYDQNGCSEILTTTVNVNQPPNLEIESTQDACFGEIVRINTNISGGNSPYSYLWNNTTLDSSYIDILVSKDTTINVTVTDNVGCMDSAQTTIIVHQNPSITLSVTNTLCSQSTGTIKAQIEGGTPPYNLEWSNGIVNQDSITNLDFGLYTLELTDSLGCRTTASALVDYFPCAELGNYVWHDINYNGIQDSLDLPLQDVVVVLKNSLDEEIQRDTTDEEGLYLFRTLEGEDYFVEFIPPVGFSPTLPFATLDETMDSNADTLTYKTNKITLSEFEKNLTIDAGWYKKVCIGDQVWNDINLNHYFDSLDIGIENAVVKLFDCNQAFLDSTFTDIFGNYSFCDLNPGEYSLQFCVDGGLIPVDPNVGDDTIDSDINLENNTTECKTLLSGDTLTICDAGFYAISSIGDYVWHDLNANGIQEFSEPSFEGIPLHLYTCAGQLLSSTVTDSTGYYIFDSLAAGAYYLEISPIQNSILTQVNSGLDSLLDSDFSMIDKRTSCIDLSENVDLRSIDAGIYFEASLGDYVWNDYDLDGLQSDEEEAVDSLKIYLYSCDDTLIDSTYSNEVGYYLFDGLMPGNYKIKIELNELQEVTLFNNVDSKLNNDIDNLTLTSGCVTLSSSHAYKDLDIGIYNLGKIGNLVWYDENGNGLQDSLEEGVPEILVTLSDCNENIVSTILTNASGEYCFSEIPYGDYTIHFDIPEPYNLVSANEGIDTSLDSDPDPNSMTIECITLSTPVDSTLDAGINTCSLIGGTAWFDVFPLNSIRDPLENGVNGIKVKAYKYINGLWSLEQLSYTGLKPDSFSDDGYWEMCLSPGEYFFEFSNISVIESVDPNQGNNEYLDSDAVHIYGINTTDIINVLPGVDNLSIGIGYRWKNTFSTSLQNINSKENRLVFNEDQSTISVEHKSVEENRYIEQKELSLDKDHTSTQINLFPNPTTGLINVNIPGQKFEPVEFIIYENTGRLINTTFTQSNNERQTYAIDVNDLESGLHHLLVTYKNKVEWIPFIKI